MFHAPFRGRAAAWRHALRLACLRWLSAPLAPALALAVAIAPGPAAAALDAAVTSRLDAELRCLLGVYTLPGKRAVTLTGSDGQRRALQYTLSDGRFGQLQEAADGSFAGQALSIRFEPCAAGRLSLTWRAQRPIAGSTRPLAGAPATEPGQRMPLAELTTRFSSDGIALHGKLVLPAGGQVQALAVWIEGSNNNPSSDDSVWPYQLASRGVAVFVYDKRGTGASGGAPTSDFHARARDTAAAVSEARRLVPHARRVGVIGASQGGWVAPLVASLVPVDFVATAFALAEGPIAQDQALVALQLREAGFDGAELLQAKALTAITERIVRTNLRGAAADRALAELEAFKTRHADAPWLAAIQPRSYTGLFLKFSSSDIQTHGPALAQGLNFDHEPQAVIAALQPRQLWLLAGRDRQAPNGGTQTLLRRLQQERGRDIVVVVFPNADHGLVETAATTPAPLANGSATVYSAGVFDITADWIKSNKRPAPERFITMPLPH